MRDTSTPGASSEGIDSRVPLVMVLMVSSPFLLLAWLLFNTLRADLQHFDKVEQALRVFDHGMAVIRPVEVIRDLAPSAILVDKTGLDPVVLEQQKLVDQRLPQLVAALHGAGHRGLSGTAERLEQAWQSVTLGTPTSNTLDPFDNMARFQSQIDDALSGTLYVSDLSLGEPVQVSELLSLQQDSVRGARWHLGVLHSLAFYTALRGGYLSSFDAQRLDQAMLGLEQELEALQDQLQGLQQEGARLQFSAAQLAPVQDWLDIVERQMVLSDVITFQPREVERVAGAAAQSLATLSEALLARSRALAESARIRVITRDLLLALGLVLLYMLVAGFGLLFYRSRYSLLQVRAENTAKSQFLARMSHEIRTPLNGVIGLTELLRETRPDSRQREYIELIDSAGRTLLGLVNDVLDFARLEAGKLQLAEAPVNLRALIEECARMFSLSVADNRNLLLFDVADDVPAMVVLDSARLRQVLINLLGNAVKFTQDGTIELHVSLVRSDDAACLRVEVVDSGIGLSEAQQERLFKVFSQASVEVARRYGGSGLGLSISRELVRLMGGDIQVQSAPDEGARFWFDLPLDSLPQVLSREATAEPVLPAPVLVLDATGPLRSLLRRQVASNPKVVLSRSLSGALDWLGNGHRPGLLLVYSPEVDTSTFAELRSLKERAGGVRVRILTSVRGGCSPDVLSRYGITDQVCASVFSREQLLRLLSAPDGEAMETSMGKAPTTAVASGGRVLVAEDNQVNQMVTVGYLKKLGLSADLVENGEQAVAAYQRGAGDYDLVLMDLDMPEMDGIEATRQIRALEKSRGWRRCPVLALSAHVLPQVGGQARDAGMDGHLIKPVSLERLSRALAGQVPGLVTVTPADPG